MAERRYNVAVVGCTGVVGETLLSILAERDFPVAEIYPLASARSAGGQVEFKGRPVQVMDLAEFDFAQADLALFSAGGEVSAEYAPQAAAAGCIVVDNTSYFRMDPEVPLIVPEVNPEAAAGYRTRKVVANPNCSTIQMVLVLKPIAEAAGLRRVVVSSYQATSGSGKAAIEELARQTRALFNQEEVEKKVYSKQIAFNCLPLIGDVQDDGYTKEEIKMVKETRKILADPELRLLATAVRVPVFYGHSEAIMVETEERFSPAEARTLLQESPGIEVLDEPEADRYPTPFEITGTDPVYVGRIRVDPSQENSLNLWVVADNVRKGAALNTVQIAELLIREYGV